MDASTYCIDLVCKFAKKYKDLSILIIGKGTFFDYNRKPNNITWINSYLTHQDLLIAINHSRRALMLTRRDTQGVMSCELATYGITLLTSDLPICREIFSEVNNVIYINNMFME